MSLISRNIIVSGRRTSIRLEQQMWLSLHDIANREKCTIHNICDLVNLSKNKDLSLTAAIRTFIMLYYRKAETEEGHLKAGHGDFQLMEARVRLPRQKSLK